VRMFVMFAQDVVHPVDVDLLVPMLVPAPYDVVHADVVDLLVL